jgi:hypothetical protein
MRSHQVFARMTPARAAEFFGVLAKDAPGAFSQVIAATAAALRARPVYMRRLSFEKRAEAARKILSRVVTNALAEEMLAVYFLEIKRSLLVEWLDAAGVPHKDGTLESESPEAPPPGKLEQAVARFRKPEDAADRELLLQAFAAQSAVEWPALEALLADPAAAG